MKLIDKTAVVAEIERLRKNQRLDDRHDQGVLDGLHAIERFLDTLEVKEVDLDFQMFAKEMDAIFALPSSETENTEEEPLNWEYAIAKHFYSLGLAQKGERV